METPHPQPGLDRLSARELQVLEMTATGRTNTSIASGLNVSVHAVKFHLASVYRKLGVSNRTQAAALFLSQHRAPDQTGH